MAHHYTLQHVTTQHGTNNPVWRNTTQVSEFIVKFSGPIVFYMKFYPLNYQEKKTLHFYFEAGVTQIGDIPLRDIWHRQQITAVLNRVYA